jgi:hypothetical protein
MRTVVVAVVAASVVAGPTAAAAVYVANADKVDNKHAVGAGATRAARAGKLVATGSGGLLPNNIIAKAGNADRLDGKDSSELGVNAYQRVTAQSTFDSTAHKVVSATCPAGTRVVGGGAQVFPSLADGNRDAAPIVIRMSAPSGETLWSVIADETATYTQDWKVIADVICVR